MQVAVRRKICLATSFMFLSSTWKLQVKGTFFSGELLFTDALTQMEGRKLCYSSNGVLLSLCRALSSSVSVAQSVDGKGTKVENIGFASIKEFDRRIAASALNRRYVTLLGILEILNFCRFCGL